MSDLNLLSDNPQEIESSIINASDCQKSQKTS